MTIFTDSNMIMAQRAPDAQTGRERIVFQVLVDDEQIGYAVSYYDGDELQQRFRQDAAEWEIGTINLAAIYRERFPASQPFQAYRVPLNLCARCGPTEWPIDANGHCSECNDRAADLAAADARIAALEAQAARCATPDCPYTGVALFGGICGACHCRKLAHERLQATPRNLKVRPETMKQRDRRERREAGF